MLNYSAIIQQKRKERQDYIDKLNAMKEEHKICELQTKYALELHDYNLLLEKMKLFSELKTPEYPPFLNKGEYLATRNKLLSFGEKRGELLDVATTLYTYEENIRRCNAVLEKSVLDGDSYIVGQNNIIYNSAKTFLKNAYNFNKYLTQDFMRAISLSAINSLPEKDIVALAKEGFITIEDVENAPETTQNKQNLTALRCELEIAPPVSETHQIRLKGVSYKNEDGSSRQEYLKELSESKDKKITIIPFLFYNTKENRDEPAAEVIWGEKCIGNLPADFVIALNEKYSNIKYSAEVDKVVGGGDFNYGCHINLTITGYAKNREPKISLSQFVGKKEEKTSETKQDNKQEELVLE